MEKEFWQVQYLNLKEDYEEIQKKSALLENTLLQINKQLEELKQSSEAIQIMTDELVINSDHSTIDITMIINIIDGVLRLMKNFE
jgi:predicted RNA-binding protein with EMAP domain